jgi:Tol biopolymer transport system component
MRGHCLRITLSLLWMCLILITTGGCITFSPSSSENLAPFSNDGNNYSGGKWSPDGHWLAASIFPRDTMQLFSPDGQVKSTWQSGCDLGGLGTNFSWVADGRMSCFIANEHPLLKLVKLDQNGHAKKDTQITVPIQSTSIVYDFQWNPHHFWLATIANGKPGDSSTLLYLSDLEGHHLIQPLSIDGLQLTWSPDGTTLAIVEQSGDVLLLTMQQTGKGKLAIVKTRRLAAGTDYLQNVAWSPSGSWLVCRHVTYESEDYLFLLATDGSGKQVKLTSSSKDGQLDYPAWSPDGKQLIISRVSDGALLSLDIATLLKEKGVKP